LLLYGKRFQYSINGRQPFTPKTASIVTVSKYEDAVDAAPRNSGNFVFYAKHSGQPNRKRTTVHQVQPGVVQDSPESYKISGQLDSYIKGLPLEITALTSPNMLLLRTTGARDRVYVYSYLDAPNGAERLVDAWGTWSWATPVGDILGLSQHDGSILIYTVRHGLNPAGSAKVWLACDEFVRDSDLSSNPYLDSLRPLASVTSPSPIAFLHTGAGFEEEAAVAFAEGSAKRLLGSPLGNLATITGQYPSEIPYAMAGFQYTSSFTPTNPYMRDRNGQAVLTGRLTVGRVVVALADSGGVIVDVTTSDGSRRALTFNGHILGASTSILGTQPIVDASVAASVGKEVREFSYTIAASKWLPLTVTSIQWVGQSFNNTRRV